MKYDAIIIGGGLGGLTAGAVLSKKGKKVLLIEQHFMVGAATVSKRKDINIEVGLHEMYFGEYGYDIKRDLFDYLELDTKIELVSLPETWDIKDNNETFRVPEGLKKLKNI